MPNDAKRGYALIVEDEEENIQLLSRILRSAANLLIARNTAEAKTILEERRVDLVISDHRLPGDTGAALLRFIAERHPSIRRILVTAYNDSSEVVAACQEGVVERFFLKPFSPSRLRASVEELLRRQGLADAPKVLIADDSPQICRIIKTALTNRSIDASYVGNGSKAIARLKAEQFDVLILDLAMPETSGTQVLEYVQKKNPDLPVIILTGADYSVGISFLEAGAFDFLTKPFRNDELAMRVERAVLAHHLAKEHKRLLEEVQVAQTDEPFVAHSERMRAAMSKAHNVAKHDVTVLLIGETGSGKDVLARYVHRSSARSEGPFIPVNCGALPETLIESELFGHEKGAFTDAKDRKKGIFESAEGGSVFLDEIGELSAQAQVRLLRVLESKEITRVGSTKPFPVDVRVIAATHRDLKSMTDEKDFRQDLYYRLNAFRLDVPPLRDRPEDIEPLIAMAVTRFCQQNRLAIPEIGQNALRQAHEYSWPGNVRELLHVVERTLITRGPIHLTELDFDDSQTGEDTKLSGIDFAMPMREALEPIFEDCEKRYLTAVLKRFDGHLGNTAEHAGIHRKSLYNKMKRYELSKNDE